MAVHSQKKVYSTLLSVHVALHRDCICAPQNSAGISIISIYLRNEIWKLEESPSKKKKKKRNIHAKVSVYCSNNSHALINDFFPVASSSALRCSASYFLVPGSRSL